MPGYGIAGPNEGVGLLAWTWAEERLRTSRNYWLATRWPDGRPHLMPVWAVWLDGALWFSSSNASRKSRNLINDPRCSLTTEDSQNPVVIEGVAERLSAAADLEAMLAAENAKYGTDYGLDMFDPRVNSTWRVRPGWAFGLRADEFIGSPTRWTFAPE
jgi:hypothetical protein